VEVGECLLPLQHETILQIERVFLNVGEIAGRQVVCLIAPIHRGVNLHLGGGIHGFSPAKFMKSFQCYPPLFWGGEISRNLEYPFSGGRVNFKLP